MFSNIQNVNGRVNLVDQPRTDALFSLYDKNKVNKTSFRDALKGNKQENILSKTFFSAENIQIIQNGLRAGVYNKSGNNLVIGTQSDDAIKLIMQEIYLDNAKNDNTPISSQIRVLNSIILDKYVNKLYGEAQGYINYIRDVSTIKVPNNYPMPSGDRDHKSLEYKRW